MAAAQEVGCGVRKLILLIAVVTVTLHAAATTYYVTVAGLGGEPDYEQRFTANAKDLDKAFRGVVGAHVVTLTGTQATAAQMRAALTDVAQHATPSDDFVLMLIGHGSFDDTEYKFNLVGPDLTATEIAVMCDHIPAKRQLVVDTTSASGGAVSALERSGRIVITATKSGTEKNATVFARYFAEALQDVSADVDKNESLTVAEVYTYASRKTAAFYDSQKRLATEHAVFNDTGRGEAVRDPGNGQGQLMASFTLLRYGAVQKASNDPAKQTLLSKKEDLEQKIDVLKYNKAAMDAAEYKKQLTAALLDLARVQGELDK